MGKRRAEAARNAAALRAYSRARGAQRVDRRQPPPPADASSVPTPMSVRNLEHLFRPRSVAIVGASDRERSVGAIVLRNMTGGGFGGTLLLVNPRHRELGGIEVHPSVAKLPEAPDLAVLCTPPASIPTLIAELGERGTKAAIVTAAGINGAGGENAAHRQAMLAAAKPHLLRVLGPCSIGLLVPGLGLNASFAPASALPGGMAFVSQSNALASAVIDWARGRQIGFSTFVCLGDSADVDLGDVLDYLARDAETHSVLVYMESVVAARKFMSAARAAARSKRVVVLRAGRAPDPLRAAMSHLGALANADEVYDAAIRRAGMLRVDATEDLFDAAETIARARPQPGDRLAILGNGRGPGVIATDGLIAGQGRLASLSPATVARLDAVLPATWSQRNPVDIGADAPAERYVRALEILLEDAQSGAVLFVHALTAIVPSVEVAAAVLPVARAAARNVFACWLGGEQVQAARTLFTAAGIPTYDTPEDAARAFLRIVAYRRNQELLLEVPPSRSAEFVHDAKRGGAVVAAALAEGRQLLTEVEAKEVLAAFGVPVVAARVATGAEDAERIAAEIGFPVVLKILSTDITHKSDVGGVALGLESGPAVAAAARVMSARVQLQRPTAVLRGFTVQPMMRRSDAHELMIGVTSDPVFGPVILFGQGGTTVEIAADRSIALPPLNSVLASDLVARTRIARLLSGYRNHPPADLPAIVRTLVQVSHLAADLPEIVEIDINPLLADEGGVVVLDARIRVAPAKAKGADRFAIRPYPEELEEWVSWQGQPLLLRPIRPDDGAQHMAFFAALDPEDIRYRVFTNVRELPRSQLARLTQIDYDREMAFIATRERAPGEHETLGVVRAVADPDNLSAEFAIIVRSDLKGQGLGPLLMTRLIDYFHRRGTRELVGEALVDNTRLIGLARRFGFEVGAAEGGTVKLRRALLETPASSSA
jgi:acetyltransferase